MKIIVEEKAYKVLKIIKAQPGDMIIRTEIIKDVDEVNIYTPFYVAFKLYAQSQEGELQMFAAYHSDQYGNIEYHNLDFGCFLNYEQYIKIAQLIKKEPLSFTEYMMKVINDDNCELCIWEDQIKKP